VNPLLVPTGRKVCERLVSGDSDVASLRTAAANSLRYLGGPAPEPPSFAGTAVTRSQLQRAIEILIEELDESADRWRERVCERLVLHRVGLSRSVVTTGYYQPILPASRVRTARFRYPLYSPPADLVRADLGELSAECKGTAVAGRIVDGRLVPYYARAEIEAGALGASAPVIAWLDDPIELFFLHIQGSGVLELNDGSRLHVGYAASNGRPYRSIGRVLVEAGEMTAADVSMQSLKDYLRHHPARQAEILNRNERYVFFRNVASGPTGSTGLVLTAGRSVAADPTIYPPGALVFLDFHGASASAPAARAAFIQDSGAAIAGFGRLDLFIGTGERAGDIAGRLRVDTDVYLPLPRQRRKKRGAACAAPLRTPTLEPSDPWALEPSPIPPAS
jgi:membrane-bound lytic murein transglycosylase A